MRAIFDERETEFEVTTDTDVKTLRGKLNAISVTPADWLFTAASIFVRELDDDEMLGTFTIPPCDTLVVTGWPFEAVTVDVGGTCVKLNGLPTNYNILTIAKEVRKEIKCDGVVQIQDFELSQRLPGIFVRAFRADVIGREPKEFPVMSDRSRHPRPFQGDQHTTAGDVVESFGWKACDTRPSACRLMHGDRELKRDEPLPLLSVGECFTLVGPSVVTLQVTVDITGRSVVVQAKDARDVLAQIQRGLQLEEPLSSLFVFDKKCVPVDLGQSAAELMEVRGRLLAGPASVSVRYGGAIYKFSVSPDSDTRTLLRSLRAKLGDGVECQEIDELMVDGRIVFGPIARLLAFGSSVLDATKPDRYVSCVWNDDPKTAFNVRVHVCGEELWELQGRVQRMFPFTMILQVSQKVTDWGEAMLLLNGGSLIKAGEALSFTTGTKGTKASPRLVLAPHDPVAPTAVAAVCSSGAKNVCIVVNANKDRSAVHDEGTAQYMILCWLLTGTRPDKAALFTSFDWDSELATEGLRGRLFATLEAKYDFRIPRSVPIRRHSLAELREELERMLESGLFTDAEIINFLLTNHALFLVVMLGAHRAEMEEVVQILTPLARRCKALVLWLIMCFSGPNAKCLGSLFYEAGVRNVAIVHVTDPSVSADGERLDKRELALSTQPVLVGTIRGAPAEAALMTMSARSIVELECRDKDEAFVPMIKRIECPVGCFDVVWSGDPNGDPTGCPLKAEAVLDLHSLQERLAEFRTGERLPDDVTSYQAQVVKGEGVSAPKEADKSVPAIAGVPVNAEAQRVARVMPRLGLGFTDPHVNFEPFSFWTKVGGDVHKAWEAPLTAMRRGARERHRDYGFAIVQAQKAGKQPEEVLAAIEEVDRGLPCQK